MIMVNTLFAQEVAIDIDSKHIYLGRSNKINVHVEGVPCEEIIVTTINGEIKGEDCAYNLIVREGIQTNIDVYRLLGKDTTLLRSTRVYVMDLPKPKVSCAVYPDGVISLELLKRTPGLQAWVGDWRILGCIPYKVVSFHVIVMRGEQLLYSEKHKSNKFSKAFDLACETFESGDKLYFLSIDAKGPLGKERANSIVLQIQ